MPAIDLSTWTARAAAHQARVAAQADAFLDRRSRNLKHPVHDFLFTYYSFPPTRLKQWVPARGEQLIVDDPSLELHPWLTTRWFLRDGNSLMLDESQLDDQTRRQASFIKDLCERILDRPARLRCFGLHEWAMVYRLTEQQVRHTGYRLRMKPEELAGFVESQCIVCSHHDAFRFFTPEARPLNTLQPTLDTRLDNEQGACLHANMDLYKWATKLWPWSGSDLIADCFTLAMDGRDLDMRASPYELADLGYEPVRIETDEGRKQYQLEQQQLADRAVPVRERLRAACEAILRE
jgi:hypothetical protein